MAREIKSAEQPVSPWLLSQNKLCKPCKKVIEEIRSLPSKYSTGLHHATIFDLESAANNGCNLCKPLWDEWSESLSTMQHAEPFLEPPQAFCYWALNTFDAAYFLRIYVEQTEFERIEGHYRVRPMMGRRLF